MSGSRPSIPEWCEKRSKALPVWYRFGTPPAWKREFFSQTWLSLHRRPDAMKKRSQYVVFSHRILLEYSFHFLSETWFLITMDKFFQKCISIYTVRQEAGGQTGGGIWRGWCCCLDLGIFACQFRSGVGRDHGSKNFASPFWWVNISIGFAPTSSWGYFLVLPHSFLSTPL